MGATSDANLLSNLTIDYLQAIPPLKIQLQGVRSPVAPDFGESQALVQWAGGVSVFHAQAHGAQPARGG